MKQCICGTTIPERSSKGRPAQFCSPKCKMRAHRDKRHNNVTPSVTKMHKPVAAPFSWFGGKRQMAPRLESLLPAHDCYVEVFGGSGALLFHKRPSAVEVYNDLDSGLFNFFSVLRNPEQARQLQELLSLTPYSREEWKQAYYSWQKISDPVEKARCWYVALSQGFSSALDKVGTGWSFSKALNPAKGLRNTLANFPAVIDRLAHVQIDHLPFARVLANYDGPDTCFYLDPPYLPETRIKHGYMCEMTREDHEQMLTQVKTLQGKVLLSGYDSPLYHDHLADWECIKVPTLNVSSNKAREARTECIWLSPNIIRRQLSLFA